MSILCPSCQSVSHSYLRTRDLNRWVSRELFHYHRCPRCGLIFLWPIPVDLGDFYPADYYSIPSSLAQLASGAEAGRYKIQTVQQFVSAGRVLEIGPAHGDFAYLAKQAGFEVDTIEMDARCCQFLREVVGVRATNDDDVPATLARGEPTAEPYSVIALWHVVEHLPDPWQTLEAAARRLAPGGILVIAAPNPGALQFRVLRSYWAHVDAPRHVVLLPLPLLWRWGRQAGLAAVLTTTTDQGAWACNQFGWRQSLSHLASPPPVKSLLRKTGSALGRLLRPLERSGRRGSTYTVVFQKEHAQL